MRVCGQIEIVHARGRARTIDGHDDRQADDNFGGRDDHDKERHDLAVNVGVNARKRHEDEVRGVEHHFDAHERDDRAAAHEDRGRTDGEQHTRKDEVPGEAHLLSSFFSMGVVVRALRARGWARPVGASAPGMPKAPERGTSGVRPMV